MAACLSVTYTGHTGTCAATHPAFQGYFTWNPVFTGNFCGLLHHDSRSTYGYLTDSALFQHIRKDGYGEPFDTIGAIISCNNELLQCFRE